MGVALTTCKPREAAQLFGCSQDLLDDGSVVSGCTARTPYKGLDSRVNLQTDKPADNATKSKILP